MDRIVSSESMLLCQLTGAFNQRFTDIDDKIMIPVIVKFLNEASIIFWINSAFLALARKCSSRLRISDKRNSGDFGALDKRLNRVTLRFGYVEFDQGAGVNLENHRRSSMTI